MKGRVSGIYAVYNPMATACNSANSRLLDLI